MANYSSEQLQADFEECKKLRNQNIHDGAELTELRTKLERCTKEFRAQTTNANEIFTKIGGNSCSGCGKEWKKFAEPQQVSILGTCFHVFCSGCASSCFTAGKCLNQSCMISISSKIQSVLDVSLIITKAVPSLKEKLNQRKNPNWDNIEEYKPPVIATLYKFNSANYDLAISRTKLSRKEFTKTSGNIALDYVNDVTNGSHFFGMKLSSQQMGSDALRDFALKILESFAKVAILANSFRKSIRDARLDVSVPIVAVLSDENKHSVVYLLEPYEEKLKQFSEHKVTQGQNKILSDFKGFVQRSSPYIIDELEALEFNSECKVYNFSLMYRNGTHVMKKLKREM